jgi:hypothetical protein
MGRDELRADAPGVDAGALLLEALDDMLVEIVAGRDGGLREAALVQDAPGLDGERREVAGVEPDARELVPPRPHLEPHGHRVAHAVERVVRVDEEDRVLRVRVGEGLERLALRVPDITHECACVPLHGMP